MGQKIQLHRNTSANFKTEGAWTWRGQGWQFQTSFPQRSYGPNPKPEGRTMQCRLWAEGTRRTSNSGDCSGARVYWLLASRSCMMKLISPLVEESWEVTGLLPSSSGLIFLACNPRWSWFNWKVVIGQFIHSRYKKGLEGIDSGKFDKVWWINWND